MKYKRVLPSAVACRLHTEGNRCVRPVGDGGAVGSTAVYRFYPATEMPERSGCPCEVCRCSVRAVQPGEAGVHGGRAALSVGSGAGTVQDGGAGLSGVCRWQQQGYPCFPYRLASAAGNRQENRPCIGSAGTDVHCCPGRGVCVFRDGRIRAGREGAFRCGLSGCRRSRALRCEAAARLWAGRRGRFRGQGQPLPKNRSSKFTR